MEIGLVQKVDIDAEMQQAYLDYAMSVIVSRALPDARDGLKPVHRRILYAMYDMGIRPDSPYKKSARIVGEVLGKYHPHGDMAVYDAMARMAQDFSMRYTLVDGQGNFGSVDGDPPAAMRYTEARLAQTATHMLADIQKNTVNYDDNFDGTLQEPSVLPSAIPNLLVNGATGIAVGMATSIPPHNLGEVVDALCYMLDNWDKLEDISLEDLMKFVIGPDFPTGGVIVQENGDENLKSAYGSGRGRVTVQARAHLEEMERGRNRIIVTELPYMTNKASLIERIAELVREEKLEGIADLRDESDRQGMRIVIELSKSVDPEAVLRSLYKHTPMRSTFSIILLALVEGEPRMLSLKAALRVYVEHRLEIVRRRSQFDLEKARTRAHILEGLRLALKHLDEIIALIRKSPDADTAKTRLMKNYKLSEIQAQAILDMPLRRLAALERKKIEDEYKEVQAQIKELESLLRSPKKMRGLVSEELLAVKDAYGDRRRTQIIELKEGQPKVSLLTASDLTPDKVVWVSITSDGLISRSIEDKQPRLSGKEAPAMLVRAGTRDVLYLIDASGEAAAIPVHTLPEADSPASGVPYAKATPLHSNTPLAAVFTLHPKERAEDRFVLTVTRQAMIKKSALSELPGPSASTFTLVRVNDGDRLCCLRLTNGSNEILLATAGGMAIRFGEDEVRPMGLVAAGVMGIKLAERDEVVGAGLLPTAGEVFLVASDGTAKRVPVVDFPKQGRYGQGVIAWKLAPGVRLAGMALGPGSTRATLFLLKLAPKQIRLDEAPLQGRSTRGSSIQETRSGEQITGLLIPWDLSNGKSEKDGAEEPAAEKKTRQRKAAAPQAKPPSTRSKTKAAAESTSTPKPGTSRGKSKTASESTPPPGKPAASPRKLKAAGTATPPPAAKPASTRSKSKAAAESTPPPEAAPPATPASRRGKSKTPEETPPPQPEEKSTPGKKSSSASKGKSSPAQDGSPGGTQPPSSRSSRKKSG